MNKLVLALLAYVLGFHSGWAQHFPVDTLLRQGPASRQINLVYVAEGYQAHEMGKFRQEVQKAVTELLTQPPFRNYRTSFNAYAIRVPSAQSGATHAGGLDDCYDQPTQQVNNYFGTQFDNYGIHRDLYPTKLGVLYDVLAASFPSFDQVFLVVNTPYYGGAGGSVATFSTDSFGPQVSVHEMGHTFADLADEYWPGAIFARENPNRTQQADRAQVRWKNWLNTQGVGVYPYPDNDTADQWFKPHTHCKMEDFRWPFCSVCTEALVEGFHQLLPPLAGYAPITTTLTAPSQNLSFKLALVQPEPNTLRITWRRNGVVFARGAEEVSVPRAALEAGTNTIQAEVVDTTILTRHPAHLNQHVYRVDWTIRGVAVEASQSQYRIEIYPNPVEKFVTVFYELSQPALVTMSVADPSGRQVKRVVKQQQTAGKYSYHLTPHQLQMLSAGVYLLVLDIGGTRITQKLVRE